MPDYLTKEDSELSPTSSLVLFLAGRESYTHKNTQKYLDYINFDKESASIKDFIKLCPHSDHIIKNRKYAVKKMAFEFLSKHSKAQVLILAAGLDPLSIELASSFSEATIFDVDKYNMEVKKQILKKMNILDSIKCITADLTNLAEIEQKLLQLSWDKKTPTLIIAEGISYYISVESLWNIVDCFKSVDNNKKNTLILEYLLPYHLVNPEHRVHAQNIFNKLKKDYELSTIVHYSKDLIKKQLPKVSGVLNTIKTFDQIEKERLGTNTIFTDSADGWIQVSNIQI